MKKLILYFCLCFFAFASDITIANAHKSLAKDLENVQKNSSININLFNNSAIYKDHGAMVGLMQGAIDIASFNNKFLDSIDLEKSDFYFVKKGKTYSFLAYKNLFKKLNAQDLKKILELINEEMGDL